MFGLNPGRKTSGVSGARYPQLDSRVIEDFIQQHSVAIRYWKAMICPCLVSDNGNPNPVCKSCRGLGWFHSAPEEDGKYVRAQVISRRSEKTQAKGGTRISGSASITFLPGVVPSDGDIVQVCRDVECINDEYHIFGSTLKIGRAHV